MHNERYTIIFLYDFEILLYISIYFCNIHAIVQESRLTSCVPRMVIEFDLSGQCESGRNRELQAWSQNMHESADEDDHPAPSSLRVIVAAQQLFRLHLRVVFRLNSRDVAFVHATISFRRMNFLLQGRVVNRTASFTYCVQQRPRSRTEYRHHKWESDFFRGYVPVSLLFVYMAFVYIPVARIGTA